MVLFRESSVSYHIGLFLCCQSQWVQRTLSMTIWWKQCESNIPCENFNVTATWIQYQPFLCCHFIELLVLGGGSWFQYPPLHCFHFCVTKIQLEYLAVTMWVQYPPLHCFHFCVERYSMCTWWWPCESSIRHYILFISVLKDPVCVLGGDHVSAVSPNYISVL